MPKLMTNLALRVAQRLKIQNRRLVVAWVAMLTAIMAAGALGYNWKDTDASLVLENGSSCDSFHSGKMYICKQGEKEFLVVPMKP